MERSFIVIEPYMIDMDLNQTELFLYAIISSFSKQKQGCYWGSQVYLATQINKSRQAVCKGLYSLIKKKLVVKNEVSSRVEYTACQPQLTLSNKNVSTVADKMSTTVDEMLTPVDKMSTAVDYIIYNNINNITKSVCTPPTQNTTSKSNFKKTTPLEPLDLNNLHFLDQATAEQVRLEFEKSEFLRQTVLTVQQLKKMLNKVLAGVFRDFKKSSGPANAQAFQNSTGSAVMSGAELNSLFENLDPDDI